MEIQRTTSQFINQAAGSQDTDHLKASLKIEQPLKEANTGLKGHMNVSYSDLSSEMQSKTNTISDMTNQDQGQQNSQQVGVNVDQLA